jgi:hypothetical protein
MSEWIEPPIANPNYSPQRHNAAEPQIEPQSHRGHRETQSGL